MTQPAAPLPVDQHDGGPGYAGPARPGRTARWKGPAAIVAAGLPAGLLWWLLAPTGLNLITRDPALAAGSNPATWLPRDLVLAGLFLLAGCLSGVFTAGNRPARLTTATVVLAVAAGAAGALLACGTGVLAGSWWSPAPDAHGAAGIAFSLRAYPILLVWPAATALSIFLATVFSRPEPEQGPGAPEERLP
ncbi:hypothetical protein AB4Y86_17000 [Arthrobacter sp. 2YAF22_2]|uniref:hypothetical protein n=1 Tax=Arthrobacter sp. 2YAF22_2 TaxID=3233029 RepID=UPI003F8DA9C8